MSSRGARAEPRAIPPVTRVMLYPREDGPAAWPATERAATWLLEREVQVFLPDSLEGTPLAQIEGVELLRRNQLGREGVELMVALGGDGTLLHGTRWVADHGIPVVGVNLGDLGFLSAYRGDELERALEDAVEGRMRWEDRERMRVEVHRDGEVIASQTACNDAYVKHGVVPRLLRLATHVGEQYTATYKADGLIVCTPTGSTAYNLAAGGPIVAPGTHVFTITPICPHSLTHRPVVARGDEPIRITFVGPTDISSAFLTCDGQWSFELSVGDEVQIHGAQLHLKLVPPRASVFKVLATKMGWSGPDTSGAG